MVASEGQPQSLSECSATEGSLQWGAGQRRVIHWEAALTSRVSFHGVGQCGVSIGFGANSDWGKIQRSGDDLSAHAGKSKCPGKDNTGTVISL